MPIHATVIGTIAINKQSFPSPASPAPCTTWTS